MLPALVLVAGAEEWCPDGHRPRWRAGRLLGLFGFSGVVAAIILGVLLLETDGFSPTRASDLALAIEYTNARGKVIAFDRADSSLRALLAPITPAPNSEGINLPASLTLFVSDQTHALRLRGSDWEFDDLKAVLGAAKTRFDRSGREHGATALSPKEVNELIPGTMSFRETHPLTFALTVGFGSAALLLLIVVGVAIAP